jgi:drug/metabolite transporter (DMT)-like permease
MTTSSRQRKRALLLLITAAVFWSMGGLLVKSVSIHPMAIAGVRSGAACLVVLLFLGRPRFTWSIPQIGGALSYAATVTCFVFATKLTTAANAILLEYTAPVYIALFGSWFLGERTRAADWLMMGACLFGMALFFLDSLAPGQLLGNVFGMMTGLTFAFLAIFLRKQKDTSNLESILLGNAIVAVIGIPFLCLDAPDVRDLSWLLILGALQLGLPYVLYAKAIRHVTALDSILIPIIEPILNPLWVFLLIGERPGPWAVAGGVIVLLAVTVRSVYMVRDKVPPPVV